MSHIVVDNEFYWLDTYRKKIRDFEIELIKQGMKEADYNTCKAARIMGLKRPCLIAKMKRFKLYPLKSSQP